MHRILLFVAVGALALMSISVQGHAGRIAAQDVDSDEDASSFTGSWRVMVTLGGQPPAHTALATFGAEGTMTVSQLPVQEPPWDPSGELIYPSLLHGAWETTAPDAASGTFVGLIADGEGNLYGTITVRATIEFSSDGQTFSGQGVVTIANPDGSVIATVPNTVEATRIVPEAPAAPSSGTPVA